MSAIVNQLGLFWWSDEKYSRRYYAPRTAVSGSLEIAEDGIARLKLSGTLHRQSRHAAFADAMSRRAYSKNICGTLIEKGESVYLIDVHVDGGKMSTYAPSTENFVASFCLVYPSNHHIRKKPAFRSIEFSLKSYKQWIGTNNIDVTESSTEWGARYLKRRPRRWKASDGYLTMRSFLDRPMAGSHDRLCAEDIYYLQFRPKRLFDAKEASRLSLLIEDFLVLLTDNESGLPYPVLKSRRYKFGITFYYSRVARKHKEHAFYESWFSYGSIESILGSMLTKWFEGFNTYGPAYHLYLGNRRGNALYPEHRFASLIWGLEALHRRKFPAEDNRALSNKIDRIIAQIQTKSDKSWLKKKLESMREPSLADRLDKLFSELPMKFEPRERKMFATECGKLRNDLSHFGGVRGEAEEYTVFLHRIMQVERALDLLYHAILLLEIGAPSNRLHWWFSDGFRSYAIKETLKAVGLTFIAEWKAS